MAPRSGTYRCPSEETDSKRASEGDASEQPLPSFSRRFKEKGSNDPATVNRNVHTRDKQQRGIIPLSLFRVNYVVAAFFSSSFARAARAAFTSAGTASFRAGRPKELRRPSSYASILALMAAATSASPGPFVDKSRVWGEKTKDQGCTSTVVVFARLLLLFCRRLSSFFTPSLSSSSLLCLLGGGSPHGTLRSSARMRCMMRPFHLHQNEDEAEKTTSLLLWV